MCDRSSCTCCTRIAEKLSSKLDHIFNKNSDCVKMEENIIMEMGEAAPVDDVKPTLYVYKHGHSKTLIQYQTSVAETVDQMNQGGLLETNKLVLIAHGYRDTALSGWLVEAKDNLIEENPAQTVVLVDWRRGADTWDYPRAAADTASVGAWLGSVASGIRSKFPDMKIWAVGHSLGAHLVGQAGRHSQGAIYRVSGLDPAGPLFERIAYKDKRLCPADAAIVDVIHTDGYETNEKTDVKRHVSVLRRAEDELREVETNVLVNHFGTLIPLGKIDFYPNFGYEQPGIGAFDTSAQHHRAVQLFNWSIKNKGKFRTHQVLDGKPAFETPVKGLKLAENWAEMGCYLEEGFYGNGLYYLKTNAASPWAPASGHLEDDPSSWGCNIL